MVIGLFSLMKALIFIKNSIFPNIFTMMYTAVIYVPITFIASYMHIHVGFEFKIHFFFY